MNRQTYYRPPTQFSVMPPVIKNLLIINVLFFLAQFVAQATLAPGSTLAQVLNYLPLYPPDSAQLGTPGFWPWQIVSYSFLHGGFGHLFFNMFILWMFGVQVENRWGSQRFGTFYFVCVIGAALTHLAFVESGAPTIGASGGVYGVMLSFAMMFPNRPIYLYFLFPIKAKWLILGLGALELFSGVTRANSGIAHFAHLGGMVFGFLLIQYWRGRLPLKPDRPMRW